jgi:hypothetical protein
MYGLRNKLICSPRTVEVTDNKLMCSSRPVEVTDNKPMCSSRPVEVSDNKNKTLAYYGLCPFTTHYEAVM